MARYSDTGVYALIAQLLADDMILVYQDSSAAEHLIKFTDFVASVEALFNRKLVTNIITGNVTLDDAYEFVVANSGTPLTITLPAASSFPGQPYVISNKGAGDATIQVTGGDHIDNATNVTLVQWQGATIVSDGVDTWHLI